MLDSDHIDDLVKDLSPYITDSLWIGKMNKIGKRVLMDSDEVKEAVKTIETGQTDENVKAILVNIFGGIVRCDRVAQGVVDAYNNIGDINVPIIVRLQGTNAEEGKELIDKSGLKVHSAIQLHQAAELVNSVLS